MNPEKKAARILKNKAGKAHKAEVRKNFLALLGKTVVSNLTPVLNAEGIPELEENGDPKMTTTLSFPPYIKTSADGSPLPFRGRDTARTSRSAFIGSKAAASSGLSRKNRPGEKVLHTEAVTEDASRSFAKEVDKILNPPKVETPVPVVPVDAAELAAAV